MKNFIIISILILFAAIPLFAYDDEKNLFNPKNECNVPGAWDKIEDLVAKYPHDKNVQILHALRLGLCFKIEQGSIDLDLAIAIFDEAHKMAVEKAKSQAEKNADEL